MIAPLLLAALAAQVVPAGSSHDLVPKTPAEWRSERFEFPLEFAPDIALEGVEELRFAPGMFERGSETHWTYLLGFDVRARGGGELEVDAPFLEDFFTRYFRGLCGAVASSKGLALDVARIRAKADGAGAAFTATVDLFDAFGDGAALTLAVDVLVHPKPHGVELLVLAAPTTASESVRAQLAELGRAWREARPVPVFLHHVLFVPDLATYAALAASPLLRELGLFEERTTKRGDTQYTALYLYGQHTYVQFVKPDPAAGSPPGNTGIAFGVELRGGLARMAPALEAAGVKSSVTETTREFDGAPLPWFKGLGIRAGSTEQRLQLFVIEHDPRFLQLWHAPAAPTPERIDRRSVLERTRAVLGGPLDAAFGEVKRIVLSLAPAESFRYSQVVSGLSLPSEGLGAGRGERGVDFVMTADGERVAPGGVASIELELRRPLEDRSVDFGQIEIAITGKLVRIEFENGLPGAPLPRRLALDSALRSLAFSPDGRKLAAATFRGTIHVFDVGSGSEVQTIVPPAAVGALAFSPDGALLVAGGGEFKTSECPLRIFDLASGVQVRELAGHTKPAPALRFSPDGKTLASASYDGTIRLWDPVHWEPLRTIECGAVGPVPLDLILCGIAFSPDGEQIAGFGYARSPQTPPLRVWNVASGTLALELTGHSGCVFDGAFSPDGKTLFAASADNCVRAWDLATAKEVRRIDSEHAVLGAGFSPDRKTIVLSNGPIRIFDAATFEGVATVGNPSLKLDVSLFAFSPDGKLLATDGAGNGIHLWDLGAR